MKAQLDRIDLSTNSRSVSAALTKLLPSHRDVPYSIHVLRRTIRNTGQRSHETIHPEPHSGRPYPALRCRRDHQSPALFSVVTFSHLSHRSNVFFSGKPSTSSDPPTVAKQMHIKQVFEHLRGMTGEVRPTSDSVFTAPCCERRVR